MPGLEVDSINKRSLFYRYCDCHYCHLTDPFLTRVGSELTHLSGYVLSGITPLLCWDRVGNGQLVPIAKELGILMERGRCYIIKQIIDINNTGSNSDACY